MSLFSSIQLANNALRAMQVGLQVTSNNIANANTPGYIREEVVLRPAPTSREGGVLIGLGVEVAAVIEKVDRFLRERLRAAGSDLAGGEAQDTAYAKLEAIVGELSDTDLSTSLTTFFGSIQDILNQPHSPTTRNLAVLRGQTLAEDISRLDSRVRALQQEANERLRATADEINTHTTEIARLNQRIVEAEASVTTESDAVGLRDQRQLALDRLAEIVNVRSVEQDSGSVTVFVGGDFLVFDSSSRPVEAVDIVEDGVTRSEIRLVETDAPLVVSTGSLAGLATARDEILGGFLAQLDGFASSLIQEFNQVFAGGQGLSGYSELTSEFAVDSTTAALDQAGLPFAPTNGTFELRLTNGETGLTNTTDVRVDLNGLDEDATLDRLVAQLDAIDGLAASVTPDRRLSLAAESSNLTFSFGNDTSGVLTALGLNTFFSGTGASDIGVSAAVRADPGKFAVSRTGFGEDTENAIELAGFLDRPLTTQGGRTLAQAYSQIVSNVAQGAAVSRAVTDGYRTFHRTLESQNQSISGVNIDEEAVRMIQYQRAFQAAAKFISVSSELLEVLVNL